MAMTPQRTGRQTMTVYSYRVTHTATNRSVVVNAFNAQQARLRAAQRLNVPHADLTATMLRRARNQ